MSTPEWELTGDTVSKLRDEVAQADEATRSDFEDFSAFVRQELGEYRIDPAHDEWAVYHGLAYMSLVSDLARNNFENGAIDHDTAAAVAAIVRGVAMALARYAPDVDRGT